MAYRINSIVVVTLLVISAVGCAFPGQRLLKTRIEHNGQVILRAQFSVPDNWDARTAWGELEKQTFESVGGWQPDPNAPKPLTLKGNVKLALDHAGTLFAAADVQDLVLQADPAKAAAFRLAPGEVIRTAKAVK